MIELSVKTTDGLFTSTIKFDPSGDWTEEELKKEVDRVAAAWLNLMQQAITFVRRDINK